MTWKTIVAGVDTTVEGGWAGAVAADLAARGNGTVHLIHATIDATAMTMLPPTVSLDDYTGGLTKAARAAVTDRLGEVVPAEAIDTLEVRIGPPPFVLKEAVQEFGADLVVLGGRHRTAVERWLEGSTAKHLIRSVDVPVLVTVTPKLEVQRVLVAVDLSDLTETTFGVARDWARAFDATLKVVHVVEPLPYDYAGIVQAPESYVQWATEEFEQRMQMAGDDVPEHAVLSGSVGPLVAREAKQWDADLVVVGSHGKGWVDRTLLGSTTYGLLNRLPASLLVVPAGMARTD